MSSPPIHHHHHHRHPPHTPTVPLGEERWGEKAGREGGGRTREEKQIKSHKLLEMSLLRCEKRREGKKRYVQQRHTGWRRTWEEFSRAVSVTRSGESLTVLHRRSALTGVGGLHFFSLQEESYPNETETRHCNWQGALKQIKRRKGDRRVPKRWKLTPRSIDLGRVGVLPSALTASTSP